MVTTTNEDGAKLLDDDLDDGGFDRGSDGLTTTEDVRNSPEVPESIHLDGRIHSIKNNNHQPQEPGNPVTREGKEDQQQARMLPTKLALSVSKVLGVTPLVKTLDKARKALHCKEKYKTTYYQNMCKETFTLVQSQLLAAQNKLLKEIKESKTEFVTKHDFAPNYEHYQSEKQ